MTTEAPMGEVIQLDEETAQYALGQRIVCMRGKSAKIDNTFLRYLLTSPIQQGILAGFATGTTVLGISQKALRSVPISFPALAEQKQIGELLGALDAKVALNRRMNETLEAMARAMFKDWFVEFGPVRAKVEGRQPTGVAPEIAALFPDALDEEGRPIGWSSVTLAEFANLNPESWSVAEHPADIEYVDLSNTKWGRIEATQKFCWRDAPSRAQRVLRPGDTIIGTVRPGNGSYAFVSRGNLTGSTGFAVLRSKAKSTREFVYFAATSRDNVDRLTHLADGGAYPAVRPGVVLATKVINVPTGVSEAFSNIAAPLLNRIAHNNDESENLAVLRDLLLPKLMSGELRIRNVEALVSKAA